MAWTFYPPLSSIPWVVPISWQIQFHGLVQPPPNDVNFDQLVRTKSLEAWLTFDLQERHHEVPLAWFFVEVWIGQISPKMVKQPKSPDDTIFYPKQKSYNTSKSFCFAEVLRLFVGVLHVFFLFKRIFEL